MPPGRRGPVLGDRYERGARKVSWLRPPSMVVIPPPVFFVSVASKGFSLAVSLLFATLAGRSINVAAKGLKARVGSNQWTAVSQGIHRKPKSGGDKMARIGFDIHGENSTPY